VTTKSNMADDTTDVETWPDCESHDNDVRNQINQCKNNKYSQYLENSSYNMSYIVCASREEHGPGGMNVVNFI
jgi:hypothetical protein